MDDRTAADELLATCWTTAGDAAPSREDWRSPVPLRQRIEAAAAAGFTGFGVLAVDLVVAEREHAWSGIRSMLADNGIVHLELEGLPDWWSGGLERARSEEPRRFLLTAAEALGARHLKVTPDTSGARCQPGHWAAEFALLAAQGRRCRGAPRHRVPALVQHPDRPRRPAAGRGRRPRRRRDRHRGLARRARRDPAGGARGATATPDRRCRTQRRRP